MMSGKGKNLQLSSRRSERLKVELVHCAAIGVVATMAITCSVWGRTAKRNGRAVEKEGEGL